jgi:hypothetical protein
MLRNPMFGESGVNRSRTPNDFGYRFGYRRQFALISASYAKLQVGMGLAGSLIYAGLRLFIIDLRYSQETQNPSKATSWGFKPPFRHHNKLIIFNNLKAMPRRSVAPESSPCSTNTVQSISFIFIYLYYSCALGGSARLSLANLIYA